MPALAVYYNRLHMQWSFKPARATRSLRTGTLRCAQKSSTTIEIKINTNIVLFCSVSQ